MNPNGSNKMEQFVRSPYNYDRDAASIESGLECKDPTLTKQSFAEEVDINTIVRRFNITGQLPTNVRMPSYGDFTGIFDFHSAMNAIVGARESFEAMPAHVRARFHNDPGEFVDFCADAANRQEAEKLGLISAEAIARATALAAAKTAPGASTTAPNPVNVTP